jgi:hypothetical protein
MVQRFPPPISKTIMLGLCLAIGLSSCGESKVVQCNKLMLEISKLESIDQNFYEQMKNSESFEQAQSFDEFKQAAQEMSTAFGKIAEDITLYIEAIQAVKVADQELQTFQETYVEQGGHHRDLIQEASGVLDEVSQLNLDAEGRIKLDQLATAIDQFSVEVERSSLTVSETIGTLQTYCGVEPMPAATEPESAPEAAPDPPPQ